MKKKWIVLLGGICLVCLCSFPINVKAEEDRDGNVEIGEENFPDERFRSAVAQYDTDHDGVLSRTERSVLKKLILSYVSLPDKPTETDIIDNCDYLPSEDYSKFFSGEERLFGTDNEYGPGTSKPESLRIWWKQRSGVDRFSLKGIEYFSDLESYCQTSVGGYFRTDGSLKSNARLIEVVIGKTDAATNDIWLPSTYKLVDCSKFEQELPMSQIRTFEIGRHIQIRKFSLAGASQLETLTIGQRSILGKADFSANTKLKKLVLRGVRVKTLDLQKNKELTELFIGSEAPLREYTSSGGEVSKVYPASSESCRLKLPKNNKIQKVVYMTTDTALDLTSCRQLRSLQVQAGVKVKLNRGWYEKNRKKLTVYARWMKVKKAKKKTKQYVYLWAKAKPERFEAYDSGYTQSYDR